RVILVRELVRDDAERWRGQEPLDGRSRRERRLEVGDVGCNRRVAAPFERRLAHLTLRDERRGVLLPFGERLGICADARHRILTAEAAESLDDVVGEATLAE